MLDDGHGFAILGQSGAGTPEHFGMHQPADLYVGLFSKALAGNGGFLSCPAYIADYISHFSRGVIFTTTLPPAMMAGVLQALRIVRSEPLLRHKLVRNVERLKTGLENIGYQVLGGASAILAIRVGHEQRAYDMVRKLQERGIHVNIFVRPAVRRGEAVLRLTVSSAHTIDDLDVTIKTFGDLKYWVDHPLA
jgi:7-keto-8-aminopelargonate synthetase-like enzyme